MLGRWIFGKTLEVSTEVTEVKRKIKETPLFGRALIQDDAVAGPEREKERERERERESGDQNLIRL